MQLDSESQERIDSFEEAFNSLASCLACRAARLGTTPGDIKADKVPGWFISFGMVLEACKSEPDISTYYDELKRLACLRNSITHDSCCNERYMSVPTPKVVGRICDIRNELTSTRTCAKAYGKQVEVLTPADTLDKVSELILDKHFSQFPVFDDDGRIKLLTENGVVRWMLLHREEIGSAKLEEISVRDLLDDEEAKVDVLRFVAASEPEDRATELFSQYPDLRAVFITEDGKESQQISGVATADDLKRKGA